MAPRPLRVHGATLISPSTIGQIDGRRLWQMGEFFEATNSAASAALSRASARHLFHTAEASPFATQLFVKACELAAKPNPADTLEVLLANAGAPRLGAPEPK